MKMVRVVVMLWIVCLLVVQGKYASAIDLNGTTTNAAEAIANGIKQEHLTFALARKRLDNAKTPACVKLLKDCTAGAKRAVLAAAAEKTLNLNGFTLTYESPGLVVEGLAVIENKCKATVVGPDTICGPHGISVWNDLAIIGDVNFDCAESALAYYDPNGSIVDLSQAIIGEWTIWNLASDSFVIKVGDTLVLPEGYKLYLDEQEVDELGCRKVGIIKRATETPTEAPTATPTVKPTATPTDEPTATPTATPTSAPALPVPKILFPVEDQFAAVSVGETVTLEVRAANAQHFQWFVNRNDGKGGVPLPGETAARLVTNGAEACNGYRYFCRISGEGRHTDSPMFVLEVLPALDIPPMGDAAALRGWTALMLLSAAGLILCCKRGFCLWAEKYR